MMEKWGIPNLIKQIKILLVIEFEVKSYSAREENRGI